MKPTLFAPVLLLVLSACETTGTQGVATASAPAPLAASVSGAPVPAAPYTTGQIVLAESVAPIDRQGGNAAVAIGSTILGAFIPGPWGSVASVTAGQAGQYAVNNAGTTTMRYHVRMPDGTIRTVTQADPLALGTGTQVQFLTLADGSTRIVQTSLPVPAPATGIAG